MPGWGRALPAEQDLQLPSSSQPPSPGLQRQSAGAGEPDGVFILVVRNSGHCWEKIQGHQFISIFHEWRELVKVHGETVALAQPSFGWRNPGQIGNYLGCGHLTNFFNSLKESDLIGL
ncbi:hypothetical protein HGM15179_002537 [Zosterops borbonicus]|uniref:Uncharacterized protein n=1 Tax=Zosterops borbonicus TaxID=364589 RepID=A0A8K1LRY3_9PASS|nr:hypothetical protein HGM15179_002537 [Zosterops borbonicus]